MAKGLDIETTAEGVETEGQAVAMRALGCDELQGFHFRRPVPAGQFQARSDDDPVRLLA